MASQVIGIDIQQRLKLLSRITDPVSGPERLTLAVGILSECRLAIRSRNQDGEGSTLTAIQTRRKYPVLDFNRMTSVAPNICTEGKPRHLSLLKSSLQRPQV